MRRPVIALVFIMTPSFAAALDPGTPTQRRVEQANLNVGRNTFGFFLEPGDVVILKSGNADNKDDRAQSNWCGLARFSENGKTPAASLLVAPPYPVLGNNTKYIVKNDAKGTTYYVASNAPNSATSEQRATYAINTSDCPAPAKKQTKEPADPEFFWSSGWDASGKVAAAPGTAGPKKVQRAMKPAAGDHGVALLACGQPLGCFSDPRPGVQRLATKH